MRNFIKFLTILTTFTVGVLAVSQPTSAMESYSKKHVNQINEHNFLEALSAAHKALYADNNMIHKKTNEEINPEYLKWAGQVAKHIKKMSNDEKEIEKFLTNSRSNSSSTNEPHSDFFYTPSPDRIPNNFYLNPIEESKHLTNALNEMKTSDSKLSKEIDNIARSNFNQSIKIAQIMENHNVFSK